MRAIRVCLVWSLCHQALCLSDVVESRDPMRSKTLGPERRLPNTDGELMNDDKSDGQCTCGQSVCGGGLRCPSSARGCLPKPCEVQNAALACHKQNKRFAATGKQQATPPLFSHVLRHVMLLLGPMMRRRDLRTLVGNSVICFW